MRGGLKGDAIQIRDSKSRILDREFYERDTLTVAQELIGKVLERKTDSHLLTGRIVETEAYTGASDPASHAYRGVTQRNSVMFGKGGVAYVYLAYGSNWCFNATTERSGKAGAVLIRALQPIRGEDRMRKNRGEPIRLTSLTNGPGKLCQAMEITHELHGTDLTLSGPLNLLDDYNHHTSYEVQSSKRVGITKASERPWRFFVKDNPYVSRNTG